MAAFVPERVVIRDRPREFVVEDDDGRTVTLRAVEGGSPRAHRIVLLHG